jgi:flagellar protein FliS
LAHFPAAHPDKQLEMIMRNNAHQNYLENEVLTAEPLKLVVLLYQGAIDAIAAARWNGEEGNRLARSKSIGKALKIIWELNRSLDMNRGGEISAQLAKLYAYIRGRLTEANRTLADPPLAEAERLLSTLLESWRQTLESAAPQRAAGPYADAVEDYAHVDYAW